MDRLGKQILGEAMDVIDARGDHYGSPYKNWKTIADFWTIYLRDKLKDGESISATDHGLMMDLVKTARVMTTNGHWDSMLDKCGYVAAAVECFEEERKRFDEAE